MLELAPGSPVEVERGPGWLFVRLPELEAGTPADLLAEQLCDIGRQHFTYRMVLEMDRLTLLRSALIGQLILLQQRLNELGGTLRIAGLSDGNCEVLKTSRLTNLLTPYAGRAEAVWGGAAPGLPR